MGGGRCELASSGTETGSGRLLAPPTRHHERARGGTWWLRDLPICLYEPLFCLEEPWPQRWYLKHHGW